MNKLLIPLLITLLSAARLSALSDERSGRLTRKERLAERRQAHWNKLAETNRRYLPDGGHNLPFVIRESIAEDLNMPLSELGKAVSYSAESSQIERIYKRVTPVTFTLFMLALIFIVKEARYIKLFKIKRHKLIRGMREKKK